jgi:hypothetical protein
MIIFGGSSSGVLYNDLGALDVTLYVSPPPPPAPQAQPKKKSAKRYDYDGQVPRFGNEELTWRGIMVHRAGSSPIDSLTGKGKYKLTVSSDGGDKHMSSPAEFSELVKEYVAPAVVCVCVCVHATAQIDHRHSLVAPVLPGESTNRKSDSKRCRPLRLQDQLKRPIHPAFISCRCSCPPPWPIR